MKNWQIIGNIWFGKDFNICILIKLRFNKLFSSIQKLILKVLLKIINDQIENFCQIFGCMNKKFYLFSWLP
jgi:hypothetical protein